MVTSSPSPSTGKAEKHVISDDEVMRSDACAFEKTPPILVDDSTRMAGMPLDSRHWRVVRPDGPAPITNVRGTAGGDGELVVAEAGSMAAEARPRRCAQHSPLMHGL